MTKQVEYETVWALGANCCIDDLDTIARLDRLCDDIGVDTIEMGATIAVAMEAGLAKFGDDQASINLLKEIGKGSPIGRILETGRRSPAKCLVWKEFLWSKDRPFLPMIRGEFRESG